MIISEKQIFQLMQYLQATIPILVDSDQDLAVHVIKKLLFEINKQQSEELKEVK